MESESSEAADFDGTAVRTTAWRKNSASAMQRRSRQPHPGEFQLSKSQAPWLKPHYWIFLSSRNHWKRQDANLFKMRIRKLYFCTTLYSVYSPEASSGHQKSA